VTQISCRALLFDLDGVLVDSTPAVARVWINWARERGFNPEEIVRRAHGRPSLSTIRELLPDSDHKAENRVIERREIEDLEGVVAAPGARVLLESLPRSKWTIVTSCTRILAEVRIRAAGLPVPEKFITSSDVQNGKPHPEPYLNGAALLGVPASDCIVVEDAPAGVRSGKEAGARVIGLLPISTPQELLKAGADWAVANCGAISVVRSENAGGELRLQLADVKG
jgi:mannitol-1-/sugar-/sorbitol-6-phosphatase